MAINSQSVSALFLTVALTGCGGGGAGSEDQQGLNNAGQQAPNGSVESGEIALPEPIRAKQTTVTYSLSEDFSEIDAESGRFTKQMLSQLSPKISNLATLTTESVTGEALYTPSGQAIYNKYSATFAIDTLHCDSYDLGITFSRSDYWGRRELSITRLNDNHQVQSLLNVGEMKTARTQWYTLSRLENEIERIRITGFKSKVFEVQVRSTCERLDSDSDGAIDSIELLSGTDILHPDTDRDGISDGDELYWKLDPLDASDGGDADIDQDGVSNVDEVTRGVGPSGYAPEVHNLVLDKSPEAGADLGVLYTFYDRDYAREGDTVTRWYLGEQEFMQDRIVLSDSHVGETVRACVTPKSRLGLPSEGAEVCTNSYRVQPTEELWTGLGPATLAGRHDGKGVDLVILGDGYTADEMLRFKETAVNFTKRFLSFNEIEFHASGWNIHAMGVVSNESGVTDRSGSNDISVDTYYNSCKGCGALGRIVGTNAGLAKSVAAQNFPQFDIVIMLVNSTKYGGVGGGVAVSTATPMGTGVIIHELGHSFAGLADEYGGSSGPRTTEPGSVNATINYDFSTVKWKHWIAPTAHLSKDKGKVGMYEGGNYRNTGLWRPTFRSQMKGAGGVPFFAVNAEAWALKVYKKAKPFFNAYPKTKQSYFHDISDAPTYSFDSVFAEDVQNVDWYLNDELVVSDGEKSFQPNIISVGSYTVKAVVTDTTGLIIKDNNGVSSAELVWNAQAQ